MLRALAGAGAIIVRTPWTILVVAVSLAPVLLPPALWAQSVVIHEIHYHSVEGPACGAV